MGTGSSAIQLPANGNTAYVATLNANLIPSFGQTVQGNFTSRRLVAESDGTLHTSLGATTNGVFELFISGSALGLDAADDNEDIDGLTITPEGQLVISTRGPVNANGGLSANGADLLQLQGRNLSLYLEGADLGLLSPGENVAALSVDADGIHLGMASAFDISGVNSQGQPITLAGDGNDVVTCLPETLGSDVKVSACSLRFDGGANGLGTLAVDNIAVGRSGMAGTDFSDEEETTVPDNPGGVDGAARIFLPLVTR
ncbi:MAG: hypothetical protein R3E79_48925 [Caldilineaceae bacterium]